MTKSFLPRLLLFTAASVVIGLASCTKDKSDSEFTEAEQQEATLASSEAEAESDNVFSDVFDNVMGVNTEVGIGGTGVFSGRLGGTTGRVTQVDSVQCFVVTVIRLNATNPFPVKIILDFGAGCVGRDGRVRKGKIITTYTGRLIHPGATATTVFENYFIDSIKVQGTHIVNNISTSSAFKLNIQVQNAKLTRPNGNYHQWNSTRVITQGEGMITPGIPIDDVFTVTGNAAGVVKRGNIISTWESLITEPLRKRFNCRWIVKGAVKLTRHLGGTTHQAVLDYGQGTCDRNATLTINGAAHNILLPL
ncbi:MAG TPA: hypothetical protein VF679_05100 [Pedobacter sp.]